MSRNYCNMVNICADGLIDVITDNYENAEERIDKWLGEYLDDTEIGCMVFNTCYHISYIPSEVWDTAWQKTDGRKITAEALKEKKHWSHKFVTAHELGVEPYTIAIEKTHNRGAKAFLSVRMNEYHYLNNNDASALFWQEHPEFRIGENKPFDYSHKEVRDYYLAYIKELCTNYDIDGIELDMLRGPEYFNSVEDCTVLHNFIKEIRKEINKIAEKKGKEIILSARVNINNKNNIAVGYDAVQWAREKLVDILVISNFFVPTSFYAPVGRWREKIGDSNCKIAVATDFCVFCTKWDEPHTRYLKNNTKTLKGFAASAYYGGADGIYTFNVMLNGYTKDVDLNLDVDFKEFSSHDRAVKGERIHIYTYSDQFDEFLRLPTKSGIMRLSTADAPKEKYKIIVGTDAEPVPMVFLNGQKTEFVSRVEGAEYDPVRENKPFISEVSETAKYVYEYKPEKLSAVCAGVNELFIESIGNVIWLEIRVI